MEKEKSYKEQTEPDQKGYGDKRITISGLSYETLNAMIEQHRNGGIPWFAPRRTVRLVY